jgi:hypothetical protein
MLNIKKTILGLSIIGFTSLSFVGCGEESVDGTYKLKKFASYDTFTVTVKDGIANHSYLGKKDCVNVRVDKGTLFCTGQEWNFGKWNNINQSFTIVEKIKGES